MCSKDFQLQLHDFLKLLMTYFTNLIILFKDKQSQTRPKFTKKLMYLVQENVRNVLDFTPVHVSFTCIEDEHKSAD
jgi:hypothetical protein